MKLKFSFLSLILLISTAFATDKSNYSDFVYGQVFYAVVNNLNVRNSPNLSSKAFTMIKEGEKVIFQNEVSTNKVTATLRGKSYTAPFLKVQLNDEYKSTGWIFAAALSTDMPLITPEQKRLKKTYDDLLEKIHQINLQKISKYSGTTELWLDYEADYKKIKWDKNDYIGTYKDITLLSHSGFNSKNSNNPSKIIFQSSLLIDHEFGYSSITYYSNGMICIADGLNSEVYLLQHFSDTANGLKYGMGKNTVIKMFGQPFERNHNCLIYASIEMPESAPEPHIRKKYYLYFENNKLFAIYYDEIGYN